MDGENNFHSDRITRLLPAKRQFQKILHLHDEVSGKEAHQSSHT